MQQIEHKQVLVIGLGYRGRAACEFLRRKHAYVCGVDISDTPELREATRPLIDDGIEVALGLRVPPKKSFDFAVLSPAVPAAHPFLKAVSASIIPIIGELELGYQQAACLSLAVAGTNGKSTTAGAILEILLADHRKTLIAGDRARPLCAVIEKTRELDMLTLVVNAFQLESTQFFRPAV